MYNTPGQIKGGIRKVVFRIDASFLLTLSESSFDKPVSQCCLVANLIEIFFIHAPTWSTALQSDQNAQMHSPWIVPLILINPRYTDTGIVLKA